MEYKLINSLHVVVFAVLVQASLFFLHTSQASVVSPTNPHPGLFLFTHEPLHHIKNVPAHHRPMHGSYINVTCLL